jgi:hypothetical protein
MAEMKIKAVFEALDKFSGPTKKMSAVTEALAKVFGRTGNAGREAAKDVGKLAGEEKQATAATDRLTRVSEALGKVLGKVGSSAKSSAVAVGGVALKGVKAAAALAAVAAAAAAVAGIGLAKSIFAVNSEFETYGATLETVLGSQQKANQALDWVQKFAAKTPYDLSTTTDAFVKLNAYGIDATSGALEKLGNAASGMNKTLDQAVEALADAQTGKFERLKEFGIRSAQQGDKVKFTYTKAGKEISIVAKKSATSIQKALLDIFDARFSGAMVRQSTTWKGLMSNLGDQWTVFQKKVGDAGVFKHVSEDLGKFLEWLSKPENQQAVDEYATKISDALTRVYDASKRLAGAVDWPKVFEGVADTITLVSKLAEVLGTLYNIMEKVNNSPIGGGLAVLGGNQSFFQDQMRRQVEAQRADQVRGIFQNLRTRRDAVLSPRPALPKPQVPRPAIGGRSFQQGTTQVGGEVVVKLVQDGPAKVQSVRSVNPNVPVNLKRGKMEAGG